MDKDTEEAHGSYTQGKGDETQVETVRFGKAITTENKTKESKSYSDTAKSEEKNTLSYN